jgi:hypothetical protein
MKSIDQLFQTDSSAEAKEGVILDFGDFRVRIARAGGANKRFSNLLNKRMTPYRRQIDTDTMDEDVAAQILAEIYADSVILGMDVKKYKDINGGSVPVKDERGNYTYEPGILRSEGIVEYNRDNVVRVFLDHPEFFRAIQADANKMSLFRSIEIEEDAKN